MSLLILSLVHLICAGEGAPALMGLCWGESPGSRALVYLCQGRNSSSHVSVLGNKPWFLRLSLPLLQSSEGLKRNDHMVLHTYAEVVAHALRGGGEMT